MAGQRKVTLEFTYEELLDLIVALRSRAEQLAPLRTDYSGAYARLAERLTSEGRIML
jgi:hypothetical protein